MGLTMKAMICAAMLLAATVSAGQAATITNGSFEIGSNPGGFATVSNGNSTAINGWTVSGGTIDYIGSYWQADDGLRSIDLSGNGPGSISTMITNMIAGVTYEIVFALSGNPDGPRLNNPPAKIVGIEVGGNSLGQFTFNVQSQGNTRANMGWVDRVVRFTANATTASLRFFNVAPNTAFGPAIDNVRISAVPVPASGLLVFGALAGLALLRRRKSV